MTRARAEEPAREPTEGPVKAARYPVGRPGSVPSTRPVQN